MDGIIVGTIVLWGLSFFVVKPVSAMLLSRYLAKPENTRFAATDLVEQDRAAVERVALRFHLAASVCVLGAAGLLGGLSGFYFLGFARRGADWPGLVAFMTASFAGLAVRALS
jgi:hypothetical protein